MISAMLQVLNRNRQPIPKVGETRIRKGVVVSLTINKEPRILEFCVWSERLCKSDQPKKRPYWEPVTWLN